MTAVNFLNRKKNSQLEEVIKLYHEGDFEESLKLCNDLLSQIDARKDNFGFVLAIKGKILSKLNFNDEAAVEFESALKYSKMPEDWKGIVWEGQGELRLKKREYENALRLFSEALKVLDKKRQTYNEAEQGKKRASDMLGNK